MNKITSVNAFLYCLLLFANFSYAADYAGCKSFCADKFRECIGVQKGISPEDCASISNGCLAQCKTLSNSASPRASESNASNSNSGGTAGFWFFVIGLGLVVAIRMFLVSERSRKAKLEQLSISERIEADIDKQFANIAAERDKEFARIKNMTAEELAEACARLPTIKSLGDEISNLTVREIGGRTGRSDSSVKAYLNREKLSAKDYDPNTEQANPKPKDPNVPKRTRGPNKPKAGAGKKESVTKA